MPRFLSREISTKAVMNYLTWVGASSTANLRRWFATDPKSMVKPVGELYSERKIIAIGGHMGTVWWIPTTGERGRPSPTKAMAAAKAMREQTSPDDRLRRVIIKQSKVYGQIDGFVRTPDGRVTKTLRGDHRS